MTKTICDICGKDMPLEMHSSSPKYNKFCISSYGNVWDICNDCRISLAEWMLVRKKKGDDNDVNTES